MMIVGMDLCWSSWTTTSSWKTENERIKYIVNECTIRSI